MPLVGILFIDENSADRNAYIFVYVAVYLTASPVVLGSVTTTEGASYQALAAKHCVIRGLCGCSTACPPPPHIRQNNAPRLTLVAFQSVGGGGLILMGLCCPITAGVQWGVEGEACRDQVRC